MIMPGAVLVLLLNVVNIVAAHAGDSNRSAVSQATKAADAWLKLVDDGDYKQSWEQASSLLKNAITDDQWEQRVTAVREPIGKVVSRKLEAAHYSTSLPGAPDGKYVVLKYASSFEHKKSAMETVTPMLDQDGEWHVSGYYIK